MSYQTEEQQVEQLKEWWKDNGTPLIVGAVLGLSGFAGWKYWNEEEMITQAKASDSFLTVTEEMNKDSSEQISATSNTVKTEYPDSSYAVLSAFQLAKQAVKENQLDKAVNELEWVLSNHGDSDLADIAKIRIARVMIAQNQAAKALSYLDFANESGYAEIANLVKGDALLSLGKESEALEAYQAASNVGKLTANHPTLNMKIAALKTPSADITLSSEMDAETNKKEETSESKTENNASEVEADAEKDTTETDSDANPGTDTITDKGASE